MDLAAQVYPTCQLQLKVAAAPQAGWEQIPEMRRNLQSASQGEKFPGGSAAMSFGTVLHIHNEKGPTPNLETGPSFLS